LELRPPESRVDGNRDRACLEAGVVPVQNLRAVCKQQGQSVARTNPGANQPRREAVGDLVQLTVSDDLLIEQNRPPIGIAFTSLSNRVLQRHGCLPFPESIFQDNHRVTSVEGLIRPGIPGGCFAARASIPPGSALTTSQDAAAW